MDQNRISILVAGPAGAGIKSIGFLLQKTLQHSGFNTFGYTEYPSLIRGGHNTFQVDYSLSKINSSSTKIDILVALDQESVTTHIDSLKKDGVIIIDQSLLEFVTPSNQQKIISLPIDKTLEDNDIPAIMKNVFEIGVIMAISDFPMSKLKKTINWKFGSKGKAIVDANIKAALVGYKLVEGTPNDTKKGLIMPDKIKETLVLSANEACGLAFIAAGGKFYSAYPMTPATNILHYLAKHGASKGILVRQASTEIEAIGVAAGASFAGARSMVGTSGGGLDLMAEFMSLLGICELPLVIIDAQRVGPATGLPTWQEQSDLNIAKYSAHGEFPRIVVAPGDAEETYYLLAKSLDLADKYQLPIIFLTDKHIAESFFTVNIFKDIDNPDRGKLANEKQLTKYINEYAFPRYKDAENDGISTRSIPGQKGGIYVCNSDEHTKEGYSTENGEIRIQQQNKRQRKLERLTKELPTPIVHSYSSTETVIVGWGSTKGAIMDTQKQLITERIYVDFIQFQYLLPLNYNKITQLFGRYKNVILVENNSTGQLLNDLKLSDVNVNHVITKYDGKPFFFEELVNIIKSKLK